MLGKRASSAQAPGRPGGRRRVLAPPWPRSCRTSNDPGGGERFPLAARARASLVRGACAGRAPHVSTGLGTMLLGVSGSCEDREVTSLPDELPREPDSEKETWRRQAGALSTRPSRGAPCGRASGWGPGPPSARRRLGAGRTPRPLLRARYSREARRRVNGGLRCACLPHPHPIARGCPSRRSHGKPPSPQAPCTLATSPIPPGVLRSREPGRASPAAGRRVGPGHSAARTR